MTEQTAQSSGTSRALGAFSDWVDHASAQARIYPPADGPGVRSADVRTLLGYARDGAPLEPREGRGWTRDGVSGQEVSWSVGFGPRTQAWLLRPAGVEEPLPGMLALHGHDGFKFFGKEKVANGPDPTPDVLRGVRDGLYGGAAFANELARRGFCVLVHDAFLWGSRRFAPELLRGARATAARGPVAGRRGPAGSDTRPARL